MGTSSVTVSAIGRVALCASLLPGLGACWRPRPNDASMGASRAPGWERGPQAGAEAQAGGSVALSWDAPHTPVTVQGVSTDPEGQRASSEILGAHTMEELRTVGRPRAPQDAGIHLVFPVRGEVGLCLRALDGGLGTVPCARPPEALPEDDQP